MHSEPNILCFKGFIDFEITRSFILFYFGLFYFVLFCFVLQFFSVFHFC